MVKQAVWTYAVISIMAILMAWGWRELGVSSSTPQLFGVHFFQNVVGEVDGRSCPSFPVCSVYAKQAFVRHGWLVGSWLTMDRLIHEPDDLERGWWVVVDGEKRLYDPLSRNVKWLRSVR